MTTTSGTKTKALCVATRCADVEQFVATYHKFCDDTSFFVATHNSRPIGLETAFSIQLSDSTPVLRGLCVVVEAWTTASNPFNRPGIRLGIRRLTADSVDVFTRLVRAARDTPRDEVSGPTPTPPPVPAASGRPPTLPPPLVRTEPVDVPLPPPMPSIIVAAPVPAGAAAPSPEVAAAPPVLEAAAAPAPETAAPPAPEAAAAPAPPATAASAPEDEPTLTTAPLSPSPPPAPVPGPPRPRAATPPPVPGSLPPRNVKPPPATPAMLPLSPRSDASPPPSPPLQPLRSGPPGTATPSRGVLSLAAPKAASGSSLPRSGGAASPPPSPSPPPPSAATSPAAATGPVPSRSSSTDLEAAWEAASATLDLPLLTRPPAASAPPATEPLAPPPDLIPMPPVLPRLARAETQLPSTPTLIPRPRPVSEPTEPDLASSLAGPPPFSMKPAQAEPEAPASEQSPPPASADKLAGLSKISSVTPLSATAFAALSSNTPRAGARGSNSELAATERETGPAAPPPPEPPAETADPNRTGTRRQTPPPFATPALATPALALPPITRRPSSEPALPTVAAKPAAGTRRVPSEPAAPDAAAKPAAGWRRAPSEPAVPDATAKPATGARRAPSEPTAGARRPPSDPATDGEARTPGSDFVLPANPLSNLTDDQLEGFIDCTLYEETSSFHENEGSIDIRDLMPATRERPPTSEPFSYTDVRRPFRSSTGQLIPIEADSQISGAPAESRRRDTPPPVELDRRRRETPPPVTLLPTVEVELDAFATQPGVTHANAANVRQSALAMQAAESRQSAPALPAPPPMFPASGMPGVEAMPHAMPPAGMANGMTTPFPGSIAAAPVYLPPTAYGTAATGQLSSRRWIVIGLSAMVALVLIAVVIKLASPPRAPEGGSTGTDGKLAVGTPEQKRDRPDERGTSGPDHPGTGAGTPGSPGGTGSAAAGTPRVGSPPGAGSSAAGSAGISAGPGPGSAALGVGPGSAGPGSADAGSGSGSARAPDQPGDPSAVGSGPCRISITASPAGAAVKVDGQSVGVSPMTLDGPCQPRRVELSHPRYATVARVVTPVLDKPESLEVTLTRPTHYLNVVSTPPGATILVEGRRAGTSPAVVQVPGFTSVRITIEKPGYKAITQRVYSRVPQDRLTVRMLESFGFGGK